MKKPLPKYFVLLLTPLLIPAGLFLFSKPLVTRRVVNVPIPTPILPQYDITTRIKYDKKKKTDELSYMLQRLSSLLKAHPTKNSFKIDQSVSSMDGTNGMDIEITFDRSKKVLREYSNAFTSHTGIYTNATDEAIHKAAVVGLQRGDVNQILIQNGCTYKLNAW